jgi:dCTP deaminase
MSVLVDCQIRQRCEPVPERKFAGSFEDGDPNLPIFKTTSVAPMIEPYTPDQVGPASYDVRLGNDFKVFERDDTVAIDFANPADITKHVTVEDGGQFVLHPGEFALGVTTEKVNLPNNVVGRIEGKSSIGRLGLMIHITAGYIDPGFRGPITLEMVGVHPLPLILRPGMLIAQISFHETSMAAQQPYQGRYQDAESVQSSRFGMEVDTLSPINNCECVCHFPEGIRKTPTVTECEHCKPLGTL